MTYRIEGLGPARFAHLAGLSDEVLAAEGVVRVIADKHPGYPCRVTLADAEAGEALLLLNHVDHDVATPYRNGFAIYVREAALEAAVHEDELPPVFRGRPISLRGYGADGNLKGALLALPGDVEAKIHELFARPDVAYIHAHNAAHGCFAARIERFEAEARAAA
ncbi:DUF1203 domain-containing protein [Sphingomonas sp.]|uniref:DUF1203 domain-containing protein n=1 Tax=Sphingomonas sp. TaxID=28214 RepID=UPI001B1374C5|nr:DUF1203 domain-containing protein [Sphingomonas sp.]MBO9714986.1 DUF1203 domain-containing protein [Sphingomonas sp.]